MGGSAECLPGNWSCRITFSNDLFTRMRPLYSIKPNLRNRFIKKLTRDRVVPIISASVVWVMGGNQPRGSVGLDCVSSAWWHGVDVHLRRCGNQVVVQFGKN